MHIDRAAIRPDTPLRPAIAAKIAFPDGSMTASGLKNEMKKGRLEVEIIAGRQYVTLGGIEKMRAQCRVNQKGHGYGFEHERDGLPSGSSSTQGTLKSAQASASLIAEKLKKRSKAT